MIAGACLAKVGASRSLLVTSPRTLGPKPTAACARSPKRAHKNTATDKVITTASTLMRDIPTATNLPKLAQKPWDTVGEVGSGGKGGEA